MGRRIALYTDAGMETNINPEVVTLGMKLVAEDGVTTLVEGTRYWTRKMAMLDCQHVLCPTASQGERKMSSALAELRSVVIGLQVAMYMNKMSPLRSEGIDLYCDNLTACNIVRWATRYVQTGREEDYGDAKLYEQTRVWCPKYILTKLTDLLGDYHNVNSFMWDQGGKLVRLGEHMSVTHLSGHPTKPELEAGVSAEGRPVSIHNHQIDKQCQFWAKAIKADTAKRGRLVRMDIGHAYNEAMGGDFPFSSFVSLYDTLQCGVDADNLWYSNLHEEVKLFIDGKDGHDFRFVDLRKPKTKRTSAESEVSSPEKGKKEEQKS